MPDFKLPEPFGWRCACGGGRFLDAPDRYERHYGECKQSKSDRQRLYTDEQVAGMLDPIYTNFVAAQDNPFLLASARARLHELAAALREGRDG